MKTLILILSVALSLNATAQKLRFTDSTNHWVTIADGADCLFSSRFYNYSGDTIIHGASYRTLNVYSGPILSVCLDIGYGGLSGFYLREDTVANKVYYRLFNAMYSPDTLEHVLYDYSLNAGDSISYLLSYIGTIVDSIVSVDSTLINGVYHKIQNIQTKSTSPSGGRAYAVVEGLGTTDGPVLPAFFPACFEYQEQLICFSQDTTYPIIHAPSYPEMCNLETIDSFVNSVGCRTLLTDDSIYEHPYNPIKTNNTSKPTEPVIFNPNPADNYFNITATSGFANNTTITVYDITGISIFQSSPTQKNSITINTSSWSNGLYIVIVQNTGGSTKEKIIVMH